MSFLQPQKFPVRHYSNNDSGAPALSNADGAIKTILKACLVTGYGDKDGAGWNLLDESDISMLLARPYQVGDTTNIRIDNGLVNGVATHRIAGVAGSSLSDAILGAHSMAAKSPARTIWHCIVSDYGFVLYYEMGRASNSTSFIYCGSLIKIRPSLQDVLAVSAATSSSNYNGIELADGGITSYVSFVNLQNGQKIKTLNGLVGINNTSDLIEGQYLAQPVFLNGNWVLPFYFSIANSIASNDLSTKVITMANRSLLRLVNYSASTANLRAIYIPLDDWVL